MVCQGGSQCKKRAAAASSVRKLFCPLPYEPRYHQAHSLSNKLLRFSSVPTVEPRAALVLNRFTRSSTIVFATSNATAVLGLAPDWLVSRSFYSLIDESYLAQTVRCLENSKSNDTTAYLRVPLRGRFEEYDELGVIEKVDEFLNERDCQEEHKLAKYWPSKINDNRVLGPPNFPIDNFYGPLNTTLAKRVSASMEIEAIITCASDGIIVTIRPSKPGGYNPAHVNDAPGSLRGSAPPTQDENPTKEPP
ncbi:predicted protein [Uncinocarpus reesii 1704]|uniref:PAS domain-containing protein n=1 Tax=Uncinocarpus reesii (strain UAMH 1704) TaxID=336963 RepID=C4JIX2_UNCRE|nr:uncharacterized protein UREG_01579 [Uncinocarpus reesii 1704]EEP76730.1 predicted protein [Uncinocarpus reesii 1704]